MNIVIVLERERESIVCEGGTDIISAEIQLSLTAVTLSWRRHVFRQYTE